MAIKYYGMLNSALTPMKQYFILKDSVAIAAPTIMNLEDVTNVGHLDHGEPADTLLIGLTTFNQATVVGGTTTMEVFTHPETVYADDADANARAAGVLLDLASGGLTVAAASNNNLIVVKNSTSAEDTIFRIHPAHHVFTQSAT